MEPISRLMVFIGGVFFGALLLSVMLIVFNENRIYLRGYEDGQIDAMNGKYKYEMIISQDTTYMEIK